MPLDPAPRGGLTISPAPQLGEGFFLGLSLTGPGSALGPGSGPLLPAVRSTLTLGPA